jgi:16S rRNA U516 pseudouridylate synthase RsuA-like enzyme
MTIREGKYHQVKRMSAQVGHPVLKLKRIAYGPLRLGRLAPGAWRDLSQEELRNLEAAAGGDGREYEDYVPSGGRSKGPTRS